MRAIVIDDARGVRALLRRMLALEGFEVEACITGADALTLIGGHAVAPAPTFALATVDLGLADTDGVHLVQAILEISPATQVLVVTGHSTSSFVPAVLRAGAFDVLYKPFDRVALQDALRRVGLIE